MSDQVNHCLACAAQLPARQAGTRGRRRHFCGGSCRMAHRKRERSQVKDWRVTWDGPPYWRNWRDKAKGSGLTEFGRQPLRARLVEDYKRRLEDPGLSDKSRAYYEGQVRRYSEPRK